MKTVSFSPVIIQGISTIIILAETTQKRQTFRHGESADEVSRFERAALTYIKTLDSTLWSSWWHTWQTPCPKNTQWEEESRKRAVTNSQRSVGDASDDEICDEEDVCSHFTKTYIYSDLLRGKWKLITGSLEWVNSKSLSYDVSEEKTRGACSHVIYIYYLFIFKKTSIILFSLEMQKAGQHDRL